MTYNLFWVVILGVNGLGWVLDIILYSPVNALYSGKGHNSETFIIINIVIIIIIIITLIFFKTLGLLPPTSGVCLHRKEKSEQIFHPIKSYSLDSLTCTQPSYVGEFIR